MSQRIFRFTLAALCSVALYLHYNWASALNHNVHKLIHPFVLNNNFKNHCDNE